MHRTATALLSVFAGLFIAALPSTAHAYTFDEACAPLSEHTLSTRAPHVLMILDRSLSMNATMPSGETRWDTAVTAITEVVNDLHVTGECPMDTSPGCDPVRFGMGWFSDSADTWVAPGEDTAPAIDSALSGSSPDSGTSTETAVDELLTSAELEDTSRPRAGVIITDGTPDWPANAIAAVEKICELRTRGSAASDTYMIGFGEDSNQEINSFMAAAGGTGTCTDSTGTEIDPCALDAATLDAAFEDDGAVRTTRLNSEYTCSGSVEVTDGEAFKAELLAIAGEFSCTFPLDIPDDYPDGVALEDPEGTWVAINHVVYGNYRIPFCDEGETECGLADAMEDNGVDEEDAEDYEDEGWRWADTARTSVKLTDRLCDELGATGVDKVDTQVGCVCTLTGEECTVTLPGFTNEQLERMRCSEGVYECVDGVDTCVAANMDNAMPELCNGIDDNCDGIVDNLDSAEADWAEYPTADPGSKHCHFQNICQCEDGGADTPSEKTGDDAADIQAHIDSWSGVCTCAEALAPGTYEQSTTDGEPAFPQERADAACTIGTRADFAAGGLALLALLGLAGFIRRR